MEEALTTLLSAIEEESKLEITELSILPKENAIQLLNAFNDTKIIYTNNKTIIDLFEEQALKNPNAIAAIFEGTKLTYKELSERSNQLAQYLINKGIEANTFVGICVERSLEMLVGILGVLKSGGAYVPIDPSFPKERINYIIKDSGLRILLSDNNSRARVSKKAGLTKVLLDSNWDLIAVSYTHLTLPTTPYV